MEVDEPAESSDHVLVEANVATKADVSRRWFHRVRVDIDARGSLCDCNTAELWRVRWESYKMIQVQPNAGSAFD
jgi:hypothetical protein